MLCTLAAASCGGDDSSSAAPAKDTSGSAELEVVALGDSEATGSGDPSGEGWVGRYAKLLRSEEGVTVRVSNLAADGTTSADLLSSLRTDASMRKAVKEADIVLLGIGGADINAGDDAFAAGDCRAEACYEPVFKSFARNIDPIAATIAQLRGSEKTVIRAIAPMNVLTGAEDVIPQFLRKVATRVGIYQARAGSRAICDAMDAHGGQCVQLLRAFNGPRGTTDGYEKGLLNHEECCYPNGEGQQLIARRVLETGLAPIR